MPASQLIWKIIKKYDLSKYTKIEVVRSTPREVSEEYVKRYSEWAGRDVEIYISGNNVQRERLLPLFWINLEGFGVKELEVFLHNLNEKIKVEIKNLNYS